MKKSSALLAVITALCLCCLPVQVFSEEIETILPPDIPEDTEIFTEAPPVIEPETPPVDIPDPPAEELTEIFTEEPTEELTESESDSSPTESTEESTEDSTDSAEDSTEESETGPYTEGIYQNLMYYAFPDHITIKGCTEPDSVKSLSIPSKIDGLPVTVIASNAFSNCSKLSSVKIPNTVKSIASRAFYDCSLTSLDLPSSVLNIGQEAFAFCNFTSLTIPKTVEWISDGAFSYCTRLTSVNLSHGLQSLGYRMFFACDHLKSIKIPDSVSTIGEEAFAHCNALTSAVLPKGLKMIGNGIFAYCDRLNHIDIPETVNYIGAEAFSNCKSLTSIVLPKGLTSISYQTFFYCTSLTSVTIPHGVTKVGNQAFAKCANLKSVNFPTTVSSIGKAAFLGTGLRTVDLCETVTTIGEDAFSHCSSLTALTIRNKWCKILDEDYTYSEDRHNDITGVIYGHLDSTAQKYAVKYHIAFELIISDRKTTESTEAEETDTKRKSIFREKYQKGDANGDGVTNMLDVVFIDSHLIRKQRIKTQEIQAIDFNGNGKADFEEALMIIRYLGGSISSLPEIDDLGGDEDD